MIGLDLGNRVVLRRVLEDLQRSIIKVHTPITPVLELKPDATLVETVEKVNELIASVNALGALLNSTTTTGLS